MATVSVVVCTYNRSGMLEETLRSLDQQQLNPGTAVELIVVDNNSGDPTPDVVRAFQQETSLSVRYVNERAQGLSHARNRGIREARGDIVAFTDDDVVADPGWVQALCDAFAMHEADCVGGRIVPLWLSPPPNWLRHGALCHELWAMLALLDLGPAIHVADGSSWNVVYGASMAFRRTVFGAVGLFRTDLGPVGTTPRRGDDTEMIGRLLRAGCRVVHTPHAVVQHKVPAERMRWSYFRRWKFHSGRSIVTVSTNKTPGFANWLVRQWLANGVKALWAYGRLDMNRGRQHELFFWYQLGQLTQILGRRVGCKYATT